MRKSVKVITAAVLTVGISTTGGFQVYKNFEELKEENRQLHNEVVLKNKLIHKQEYINKELNTKNVSLQTQLKVKQSDIDKLTKNINEKDRSINSLKLQLEKAKKKNESPRSQLSENPKGRVLNIKATAYGADCKGCTGITSSGYNVRDTIYYQGLRIVAMDTSLVPMYSIVEVQTKTETFKAIVLDRGGDIKGHRMDVLTTSEADSNSFGRQQVKVTVLREGK